LRSENIKEKIKSFLETFNEQITKKILTTKNEEKAIRYLES
jgi:hypothetical protein